MSLQRVFAAAVLPLFAVWPAPAQAEQRFEFAGGELKITETADFEKVLAFDGRELARDYEVFLDRITDVGGTQVAFFGVGSGGNACAPAIAIVWQDHGGEVRSETFDAGCGTPSPAVSGYEVYFVPYLLPGASADVHVWGPVTGMRLHGRITYAPQPGTGWESFDPAQISHPLDLFRNAAIYAAAQTQLGLALREFMTGLGTAAAPERTEGGLLYSRGCVPHGCGVSDSFVVVDAARERLYFAQQGGRTASRYWPARDRWPEDAAALLPEDF